MAEADFEDLPASGEAAKGEESDEEIEVTAAEVLERLEEVQILQISQRLCGYFVSSCALQT